MTPVTAKPGVTIGSRGSLSGAESLIVDVAAGPRILDVIADTVFVVEVELDVEFMVEEEESSTDLALVVEFSPLLLLSGLLVVDGDGDEDWNAEFCVERARKIDLIEARGVKVRLRCPMRNTTPRGSSDVVAADADAGCMASALKTTHRDNGKLIYRRRTAGLGRSFPSISQLHLGRTLQRRLSLATQHENDVDHAGIDWVWEVWNKVLQGPTASPARD
ncbi:hypothetical protein G7Y89_g13747 [Cudoniella acicularis]|uniref:Uncharacterized protein n=1 Tax=Cudoniella acicularis TaxID=354080 RepID=A0A8H4R980_9HELO|nr:hypothetical protein G7Y89_g13747 [Cudoniella acicularis]